MNRLTFGLRRAQVKNASACYVQVGPTKQLSTWVKIRKVDAFKLVVIGIPQRLEPNGIVEFSSFPDEPIR